MVIKMGKQADIVLDACIDEQKKPGLSWQKESRGILHAFMIVAWLSLKQKKVFL